MPPEKGAKVRLGSPLGIVDHAGAICTFVQCYPDHAKLIFYLFSKASPLIDQRLLLLGRRLKDIDQRDQIPLSGNKHLFSPVLSCSIDGPCLIVLTEDEGERRVAVSLSLGGRERMPHCRRSSRRLAGRSRVATDREARSQAQAVTRLSPWTACRGEWCVAGQRFSARPGRAQRASADRACAALPPLSPPPNPLQPPPSPPPPPPFPFPPVP